MLKNFFKELKNLDRDLYVVFISVFLFAVGYGSVMYYIPLLLKQIGASTREVGYIYSTVTASAAISALIGGFLLERFNLRNYVTFTSLLIAPFALIMYFATDWRVAFIAAILDGMSYAAAPGFSTIVYLKTPRKKLGFAMGIFSSSFSAGAAFSPALGGLLAREFGIRAPFLFSFIVLTLSALVCLLIKTEKVPHTGDNPLQALKRVLKEKRFTFVLVVFMLLILLENTYDPFLSIFLKEVHGIKYEGIGILISMVFIINLFSSPVIGRIADIRGASYALAISLSGYSAALLLLSLSKNLVSVYLSFFLIGLFKQVYSMSSIAASRNTGSLPPHIAYASLHFLRTSLAVLGPSLGGIIASYSLNAVILTVGISYLIVAAASYIYSRFFK